MEKLDEWRATIRCLVGVANKDEPRLAGPVGRRSVKPPHASGGRVRGVAATLHSPPPRQLPRVSIRRDDACDNISIASSDPRTHRDQRQVLREQAHEDAQTTIERRRDTHHQSDKRAGPAMDHPAPGGSDGLPYEVGCPAFTRELRQFQWPSHRTFKPDVSEKYNGKTICQSSSTSTPSRCKLPEPTTTRCLPITSRWHSNPTSCCG